MKKSELQEIIRQEIKTMLTESSSKFQVDDMVKVVTPSMSHSGKTGTVVDISPSESFFLVKFSNNQNAYFHEADLKLVKGTR